jgi:hypothetical protein
MENENLDNATPENPAQPEKTPLEMVKEQQARMQNREVLEERVESHAEVPGGSVPSNRRKHPHRQLG